MRKRRTAGKNGWESTTMLDFDRGQWPARTLDRTIIAKYGTMRERVDLGANIWRRRLGQSLPLASLYYTYASFLSSLQGNEYTSFSFFRSSRYQWWGLGESTHYGGICSIPSAESEDIKRRTGSFREDLTLNLERSTGGQTGSSVGNECGETDIKLNEINRRVKRNGTEKCRN